MRNHTAFIGSSIIISMIPNAQPRKAPMYGIIAVAVMSDDIASGYGKPNMFIATKNKAPRITASRHCPLMKFENVFTESEQISHILSATDFFMNAYVTCFVCLRSFCLFERMYAAKMTDVTAVNTPLIMEDAPLIMDERLDVSVSTSCNAYSERVSSTAVMSREASQSATGSVFMPYFSSSLSHSTIFGMLTRAF